MFFWSFSFLSAIFLAKRYVGMDAGFFSLAEGEFFLLLFLCLVWYLAAKSFGLYDEFRSRSFSFEFVAMGKSILILLILVAWLFYSSSNPRFSRAFLS